MQQCSRHLKLPESSPCRTLVTNSIESVAGVFPDAGKTKSVLKFSCLVFLAATRELLNDQTDNCRLGFCWFFFGFFLDIYIYFLITGNKVRNYIGKLVNI